jgi:hypothetical protein
MFSRGIVRESPAGKRFVATLLSAQERLSAASRSESIGADAG